LHRNVDAVELLKCNRHRRP